MTRATSRGRSGASTAPPRSAGDAPGGRKQDGDEDGEAEEQHRDLRQEPQAGEEAVELARSLRPDVVLMNLLMPRMDGVAATEAIRAELPEVEVVALTSVLEDAAVTAAIRAGAIGYLLRTRRPRRSSGR